jgi:hypothetical protein
MEDEEAKVGKFLFEFSLPYHMTMCLIAIHDNLTTPFL